MVAGLRELRERRTKAAENTQALYYDDVRVTTEHTRAKNLQTWARNREQRQDARTAYKGTQQGLEFATEAAITAVKNDLEGLDPCEANDQNLTQIRSAIDAIRSNNLVSSPLMTPNERTDKIFDDLGYVCELLAVFETFVKRRGSERTTVAFASAQGVTRETVLRIKIYTDEKRILCDAVNDEVFPVTTLRVTVKGAIENLERVSKGGCGASSALRDVFKNLASAKNTLEPRGDRKTLTWYKKVEDETREEIRADDERCRAVIEKVKTFVEDKKYPADNRDTLKLCKLSGDQEETLRNKQREVQELKDTCKSLSPAYDNEIRFWTKFFENVNAIKARFRVEVVNRNNSHEQTVDILEKIRLVTSRISSVDVDRDGPTNPEVKIHRLMFLKRGVETLKAELPKILCKDDAMKRALLDLTRLDLFVDERKKGDENFDRAYALYVLGLEIRERGGL